VTLAYDGQEALDVLEGDDEVGLAVLDVMMPRLSGLDVLAAIRADERRRALPCIILTAAGQDQQHERARALGADEFLTKPFSPKKLYARAAELTGLADESEAQSA
jgi:CheY-like chemotaxis protein